MTAAIPFTAFDLLLVAAVLAAVVLVLMAALHAIARAGDRWRSEQPVAVALERSTMPVGVRMERDGERVAGTV